VCHYIDTGILRLDRRLAKGLVFTAALPP
jgi:hypothetical protein